MKFERQAPANPSNFARTRHVRHIWLAAQQGVVWTYTHLHSFLATASHRSRSVLATASHLLLVLAVVGRGGEPRGIRLLRARPQLHSRQLMRFVDGSIIHFPTHAPTT
jgi:hypothetical protein